MANSPHPSDNDPIDILNKKRIDWEIEKSQILRILPELILLLKKLENCKYSIESLKSSNSLMFYPIGESVYSETLRERLIERWSNFVYYISGTNDFIQKLLPTRIFNIQRERKEIIRKNIVEKINLLLKDIPENRHEVLMKLQNLDIVLDEAKTYFSSIIKTYQQVLETR